MCSNAELARSIGRIEKTVTDAKRELQETRLEVKGIATRMDTWEETKCGPHDNKLREIEDKLGDVGRIATSAAFKATAMYTIGMLVVGGVITWALKATLGA